MKHDGIQDPIRSPLNVQTIFSNTLVHGGVSNTVRELLDNMTGPLLAPRLWIPQCDPTLSRAYHRAVFPRLLWRGLRKAHIPNIWMNRAVMRRALRDIKAGDLVYLWPPYNTAFMRRVKDRGGILIAEKINCMAYTCKTILESAYSRIGNPLPDGWCLPKDMAEEKTQMSMCDYVAAPSEFVAKSLIDAGIASDRILRTSYGWSPMRLSSAIGLERPERLPVFAFVGYGIVRKGLNLLLEAWEKAEVKGKLLIAGAIDKDIEAVSARQLARPDVEALGYVRDIASVFAAADVFVLPTHEEGSPQVSYEAAGCGLASIVSPMGKVPIVRDGQEGYVVDPYDTDAWVAALRILAKDASLRHRFAAQAAERAKEYTWQKVGARMYDLLVRAGHPNYSEVTVPIVDAST